ncbi:hypothetical protein ACXGQW_03220 [Wenyingzhuangia sp. IMCC45533]
MKIYILILVLTVMCSSCVTKNDKNVNSEIKKTVSSIDKSYMIDDSTFYGIKTGTKISDYSDKNIKIDTLKTGEGDFIVYLIYDDFNEKIGYFSSNPNHPELVGDITITSPKAITSKGYQIGMPYHKLKEEIDNLEVHGSEIDSRTYVKQDYLTYQLNYNNNKYDLDKDVIPSNTRVESITIHRK